MSIRVYDFMVASVVDRLR